MQQIKKRPLRIGIIGGMGPEAGVEFHRLIIEATPATCDQEHLEVLCYSRPGIPDRTESLRKDNGARFVEAVVDVAKVLVNAEVHVIAMPCITAHARFAEIARHVPVPLVDMVDLAAAEIILHHRKAQKIGILATDGTIRENIFSIALRGHGFEMIYLGNEHQRLLMRTIYAVKAGRRDTSISKTMRALMGVLYDQGARAFVLACSELSLFYDDVTTVRVPVIDPLRVTAHHLVQMAFKARAVSSDVTTPNETTQPNTPSTLSP